MALWKSAKRIHKARILGDRDCMGFGTETFVRRQSLGDTEGHNGNRELTEVR